MERSVGPTPAAWALNITHALECSSEALERAQKAQPRKESWAPNGRTAEYAATGSLLGDAPVPVGRGGHGRLANLPRRETGDIFAW
jgi:hypothetical protein